MTDDRREDLLVVAAGHQRRLERLRANDDDVADSESDPLRVATDALLGETPPFDGDPDALRSDVDRLLGLSPPRPGLVPPVVLPPPTDWGQIVETNRREVDGRERIEVDDLFDPSTLAAVEADWQQFSRDLDARLDARAIEALGASCRRAVLDAIIRPLGLGRLVARFDHHGGNVLTPHNADAAWRGEQPGADMANPARRAAFEADASAPYHHADYEDGLARMRKEHFKDPEPLTDAYAPHRELPRDGRAHLDHVISAREIHGDRDANFFLSADEKRELANDPANLAFTQGSLNQSKGDERLATWMDKERRDGTTNAEHHGIDRDAAMAHDHAAEAHRDAVLSDHRMKYFLGETARAGGEAAMRMGLQQAAGLLLVELAVGLVDEVLDLWRNGRREGALVDELIVRAKRVGERVIGAWREAVDAFWHGALVGLLSTILTTVINCVMTTTRRVVRLIREGLMSLSRAVRVLLFPPAGMDDRQAAHEAMKLVATGLALSAGIVAEDAAEKAITAAVPVLAPIAAILATAGVGLATGLASVAIVAVLDHLDFFGVIARERGEARVSAMRARTDRLLDEILAARALASAAT